MDDADCCGALICSAGVCKPGGKHYALRVYDVLGSPVLKFKQSLTPYLDGGLPKAVSADGGLVVVGVRSPDKLLVFDVNNDGVSLVADIPLKNVGPVDPDPDKVSMKIQVVAASTAPDGGVIVGEDGGARLYRFLNGALEKDYAVKYAPGYLGTVGLASLNESCFVSPSGFCSPEIVPGELSVLAVTKSVEGTTAPFVFNGGMTGTKGIANNALGAAADLWTFKTDYAFVPTDQGYLRRFAIGSVGEWAPLKLGMDEATAVDGSDIACGEVVAVLGKTKSGMTVTGTVLESRRVDNGALLASYTVAGKPVAAKVTKGEGTCSQGVWIAVKDSPQLLFANIEAQGALLPTPLPATPIDMAKTGFVHLLTEE